MKLSTLLTNVSRFYTIARNSQGESILVPSDPRPRQPSPSEVLRKELEQAFAACGGDPLYEQLRTTSGLGTAFVEGKIVWSRDGLQLAIPPALPPALPLTTPVVAPSTPPQNQAEGGARDGHSGATKPGGAAATLALANQQAKLSDNGPSRLDFTMDVILLGTLLVVFAGTSAIVYLTVRYLYKFFRTAEQEFKATLESVRELHKDIRKEWELLKKDLSSKPAPTVDSMETRSASRVTSREEPQPRQSVASHPPTSYAKDLVRSCNLALAGSTGALAAFAERCDGRAYERAPGAAHELRAEPDQPFDRSYFWFVEGEGNQLGEIFPGRGIPLDYASLMADDGAALRKLLDGVFDLREGSGGVVAVEAAAKAERAPGDRLRVIRLGRVAAPVR